MIRRDPDELVVPVRDVLAVPEDLELPRPIERPVFREDRLAERIEFHPVARRSAWVRKLFRVSNQ